MFTVQNSSEISAEMFVVSSEPKKQAGKSHPRKTLTKALSEKRVGSVSGESKTLLPAPKDDTTIYRTGNIERTTMTVLIRHTKIPV